MLRALKEQLSQMAEKEKEAFAKSIQTRVGGRSETDHVQPLRNLILVMPDLIAQVRVWNNAPEIPASLKNLHGFLLTYLYEPADFLSTHDYGLFGYLDDAYVVASVYARTLAQLGDHQQKAPPRTADIARQVPAWLEMARRVLPAETGQIDQMLTEFMEGRSAVFEKMMARTSR